MNDPWHTAIHEAGHAVVGRVLGMDCGAVTIKEDDDSAGHSVTNDPHAIAYRWECCGRYRELGTVFRGRVMTYMAGAEAEIALIGHCEGGDEDDRLCIADMLQSEARIPAVDNERLERRLRRATALLVRRHSMKIGFLARALMDRGTLRDDDEIRMVATLPPPRAAIRQWWADGPA